MLRETGRVRNGYSLGKDLGSRQDAFLGTGGMRQRKTLEVSEGS